ncbi:hypothetical protein ATE84_5002 [Aquimarina sp. MAR_2010_214]|uniref:hypothetical protein n=1 Tax=Aquimarina sp. MAR_2010_214 TaxID=1250026 RepID=UPI000C7109CA|nr:hypothetical protein [Aquimarina sp. MAR_2010_214]PKV52872.1 hypothetical protein ATE84_5002 [Aquimarina sp. MAR_2010_214]
MKKIILKLIIVLMTMTSFAQVEKNENVTSQNSLSAAKYRLFSTQNMWTFIKLNTRNGRMWQVQYDVKDSNRFETYLNILSLVDSEEEADDRFTLYPTQNIYNFILLDQLDGRVWQVQWSTKAEQRVIIPIE